MSGTKAERLAASLNEFIQTSPDVEAAAVVSFDGLAMASALPDDMDEDRVGAMSAALLSLGEQAARGLGRGDMRQLFVEGEHGYVFLMSARDQAVLAAVTDEGAKIGFILYEMRRAADTIGAVLEARAEDAQPAPERVERWEQQSWEDSLESAQPSPPEPAAAEAQSSEGQQSDPYYVVAGGDEPSGSPLQDWR